MHEDLAVVDVYLRKPTRIRCESSDEAAASKLYQWVRDSIIPSRPFAKHSQFDTSTAFVMAVHIDCTDVCCRCSTIAPRR